MTGSEHVEVEGAPAGAFPWQLREEIGLVAALLRTVKLVALSPAAAFAVVDSGRRLTEPLLFAVIVCPLAVVLNILGVLFVGSVSLTDPPPALGEILKLTIDGRSFEWIPLLLVFLAGSVVGIVVTIVFLPPVCALFLFLSSGVLHLSMKAIGGTRGSAAGFRGTFAVAAYSSPAFLVHLVPVAGDLLATIWVIVLLTIGLATVHETSRPRALLAVLLPAIVLGAAFALTLLA